MNNTALFLLFPLPSNINPKNKVPTKGSWWTNKRIKKKKIKQKRRCSWKCHKDWCYPNKKILFSKNILHCIAKSFDRLCCKACERKKLPIELRQMLTLTPICDVNTQGAEKLLLSSSPSYYILPFFCKKEKKRMEIEMIQLSKNSYFEIYHMVMPLWLKWSGTRKTNLFSATCKLCLFTVGRRTKSEHNKILPWYSVSTEALFILIHKMMKQPRLYP